MFRRAIAAIAAHSESGMRAAHVTHAVAVVEHDWPALAHGAANVGSVFAMLIIVDAAVRLGNWGARKVKKAIDRRRERKATEAEAQA